MFHSLTTEGMSFGRNDLGLLGQGEKHYLVVSVNSLTGISIEIRERYWQGLRISCLDMLRTLIPSSTERFREGLFTEECHNGRMTWQQCFHYDLTNCISLLLFIEMTFTSYVLVWRTSFPFVSSLIFEGSKSSEVLRGTTVTLVDQPHF